MAPIDNTFDFLSVKEKPVDTVASEDLKQSDEQESKGNKTTYSLPCAWNFQLISSISFLTDHQEVDEFLPAILPPQKDLVASKKLASTNEALKRREWAHEINVNEPFDNFYDLVPEMAMQVIT